MSTYKILVKEVLEREVEVEADTLADANEKVHQAYSRGEIVLNADDFAYYDIDDAEWWTR